MILSWRPTIWNYNSDPKRAYPPILKSFQAIYEKNTRNNTGTELTFEQNTHTCAQVHMVSGIYLFNPMAISLSRLELRTAQTWVTSIRARATLYTTKRGRANNID